LRSPPAETLNYKMLSSGDAKPFVSSSQFLNMNIVQTFRRLGQQMSGLGNAFDMQSAQMPLIKKLYAKNGLEIKGGGACPEQYDVFKDGQQVAYYRLRHGEFTVDYPNVSGEEIMAEYPNGDGIFDDNERLVYLSKAMRQVLLKLKTVGTGCC
jgi:hypothetical protein